MAVARYSEMMIAAMMLAFVLQKQMDTGQNQCEKEVKTLNVCSIKRQQNSCLQIDPCEEAKPGIEAASAFSKTKAFQTALTTIKEQAAFNSNQEQIVAFGKDSSGNVLLPSIASGRQSSAGVPAVLNAFADLHNHPKNTPPSSGDLYGLIRKNRKDSSYKLRFVFTPAAQLYALYVADVEAAGLFLARFPPQQVDGYSPLFPEALFLEFRNLKDQHGATDETAIAFMLNKYNAGVCLLKQVSTGEFKAVRALVSGTENALTIAAGYCP